jgi:outer membrane protein insertion porin family
LLRPLRAALLALTLAAATLGAAARADPPQTSTHDGAPPQTSTHDGAPPQTPGAEGLLTGEDLGLGTTVPDLGAPVGRDLVGKPIRRVEVVTVGGRWAAPLAVTAVRPGDPASPEAARQVMREALATGRFARADVEAYLEGGGVVLRLDVLPRRLVASVQLGGSVLDTAETLDAAEVAVGGELTAPRLPDIAAKVRRFYERRGFPAAEVSTETADTDQPDKVILTIAIVPGKPRTVSRRVFVIEPAADREVGDLKSSYKVGAGARVDEPSLAEADRDLGEVLRQHGFSRAEVRHLVRGAGAFSYLYVYVLPGPRLVPAFEGNHAFDAVDLLQALGLEKAADARAGELVDRLRAFYVTRGFLDAEVSMAEKGKPEDAVHYLAFTIREHRQVRVTRRVFPCLGGELSPDFIGNEIGSFLEEELPGAEPFGAVDPRVVAKIWGPTAGAGGRGLPADLNPLVTYAPETYERAIKHVRDVLHARGYLNAVVGPLSVLRATCSRRSPEGQCIPLPPKVPLEARCLTDSLGLPLPEPSVPDGFTCRPDPARDVECSPEVTLRIPIAPGPQTTLYDLAFEGNRSMNGAELARVAELPLGGPLSSVELEAARLRVLDAYRLRGFAYADVRAEPEPSPDRTRARVRFYVTEREKVTVTDFVVKGATRTSEALILRRVALKKGFPYRQDWARQTEERVATLGTFSSVAVALEDADVPERRKRVVITVVENPAQYLETRPGFSTGDGVRLTFEYGHRNLGGLAVAVTLRLQLSYLPDAFILDPTVLANLDTLGLGQRLERRDTLSFHFPEVGLGPLVSLSLDLIDLNDNERDFRINKEAIVPTITYRPIRQLTTQLGVSTEFNDVAIFDQSTLSDTTLLLHAPQGLTLALAERLAFTADYRDNPFNPTKGVFFTTAVEHVNAFPISGSDAVESHFLRFTGRVAGYLTRFGVTLATSLAAGGNVQLFDGSQTYPDRLFFLGGVDSHRAFLDSSLVPQDIADHILKGATPPVPCTPGPQQSCLPTGQRALTIGDVALRGGDLAINPRAELRIPLFSVVQTGVFLDMGNVWLDPTKLRFDANFLRYGLGTGLRISTPIGPLALDYGFNLNRRPWEDVGAFHFSIGLF